MHFRRFRFFLAELVHVHVEHRSSSSHGTDDPILPIQRCDRQIARELKSAEYTVNYRDFSAEHMVPSEKFSHGCLVLSRDERFDP